MTVIETKGQKKRRNSCAVQLATTQKLTENYKGRLATVVKLLGGEFSSTTEAAQVEAVMKERDTFKQQRDLLAAVLRLFQASDTVPGKFLAGHFGGCTGGDPEVGVGCDQECEAARDALKDIP